MRLRLIVGSMVLAMWTVGCSDGPTNGASLPSKQGSSSALPRPATSMSSKPIFAPASTEDASAPPIASSSMPPSASSEVAPPRAKSRRGLWIWEIGKNGPPAARAAEEALRWGVGRVFIKSSEGAGGVRAAASDPPSQAASAVVPEPPHNRWAQNFSSENVRPFLERGIEVWAFGYFYPDRYVDPDGVAWGSLDAQVAASVATLHEGVTGLVVDAESEFNGHDVDAEKLCRLLRAKLSNRKLAFTSFGWLSAQRKFPFKAFDKGCGDAFLPQVYYDFGWPGGVEGSLERMRRDIAALGLKAPVWPVQSNERNASVADMTRFFEQAGEDASIFYLHTEDADQTRRMSSLGW